MHLITFLTDFGNRDWFVAAVKGEILKHDRRAHIIDITHSISPHDVKAAAFVLRSVFSSFPKGTIHLVVVDPGVGSKRKALIVKSTGHIFVGPDNGVFSYVYNTKSRVYEVPISPKVSSTFHGRDVFGPLAGQLSRGVPAFRCGKLVSTWTSFEFPRLVRKRKTVEACILYIDRFGNLITNVPNSMSIECFKIGKRTVPVAQTYDTAAGSVLKAVKGSHGYYEIAVFEGSAKKSTNAVSGMKLTAYLC
jgi:S-adenosylmethionine hydrolase